LLPKLNKAALRGQLGLPEFHAILGTLHLIQHAGCGYDLFDCLVPEDVELTAALEGEQLDSRVLRLGPELQVEEVDVICDANDRDLRLEQLVLRFV